MQYCSRMNNENNIKKNDQITMDPLARLTVLLHRNVTDIPVNIFRDVNILLRFIVKIYSDMEDFTWLYQRPTPYQHFKSFSHLFMEWITNLWYIFTSITSETWNMADWMLWFLSVRLRTVTEKPRQREKKRGGASARACKLADPF